VVTALLLLPVAASYGFIAQHGSAMNCIREGRAEEAETLANKGLNAGFEGLEDGASGRD
jgi:hypothetical protein